MRKAKALGMRWLTAALLVGGMFLLPPAARAAAAGADFALPNGHFYSEANGRGGGPGESGFAIVDSGGIPFWTVFVGGGGVAAFGYPVSRPFPLDGFTDQVMQKAIFQWDGHAMAYLNVLDFLHREGKDGWLQANEMTPPALDTAPDTGLPWPQVVARHQRFLDSNAALRAAYFAVSDPLARYGLPLTPPTPEANGAALVVRCQRAVLQLWLTAQPWAAAGQVTVANAGDLAKAADVLPFVAVIPQSASSVSAGGNAAVRAAHSENWAGYAIVAGPVTDVAATWTVPTADCAATPNGTIGVSIGIDGVTTNTVESIGIRADCKDGQASYAAWKEASSVAPVTPLPLSLRPGDVVRAEVTDNGNSDFWFTLTDLKSGKAVSAQQHAPSGRASAEWIVQIPTLYNQSIMPPVSLPSLTAVDFTGATAVIGGVRGTISNPAWQAVALTMVSPTGAAEAVPSPLSMDGSSFQVTWRRS